MEQILSLIEEYGTFVYVLLFAYCALKSGSLPLFGGYAAQAGALDVGIVAAAVFAGGYLGDEARFLMARRHGAGFLNGKPRLTALMQKATILLDRYGAAYVFLYRYPKGMRTIGALPVGLTNIEWQKFTALNAASAAVWVTLLVGGGYIFGAALEEAVMSGWGALSILLLAAFLGLSYYAYKRLERLSAVAEKA